MRANASSFFLFFLKRLINDAKMNITKLFFLSSVSNLLSKYYISYMII